MKKKKQIRKDKRDKLTAKEKMAKVLDIPSEVVSDRPRITTVGKREVFVENYKGILAFSSEIVKINSNYGVITITGKNMKIREITSEDIIIFGDIENIDV